MILYLFGLTDNYAATNSVSQLECGWWCVFVCWASERSLLFCCSSLVRIQKNKLLTSSFISGLRTRAFEIQAHRSHWTRAPPSSSTAARTKLLATLRHRVQTTHCVLGAIRTILLFRQNGARNKQQPTSHIRTGSTYIPFRQRSSLEKETEKKKGQASTSLAL